LESRHQKAQKSAILIRLGRSITTTIIFCDIIITAGDGVTLSLQTPMNRSANTLRPSGIACRTHSGVVGQGPTNFPLPPEETCHDLEMRRGRCVKSKTRPHRDWLLVCFAVMAPVGKFPQTNKTRAFCRHEATRSRFGTVFSSPHPSQKAFCEQI
jgi:hypothetical protein